MIIDSKDFPDLKHLILLTENKHKGMFNFEQDIIKPTVSLADMHAREQTLSFEDVVNI